MALSCLLATLFSWMDRAMLFVYLPAWLVVGVPVLALAAAVRPPYVWAQRLAVIALTLWGLVALPRIRWNDLKAFYVDCRDLRRGMPVADARARMARYIEVGRTGIIAGNPDLSNATAAGITESEVEHRSRMIFIPSEDHGADWCLVYPERDRVARVEISPD